MKVGLAIVVVILLSLGTSGGQQQSKVTGFFTDMHYIEGAGDVLGTEVWIVYGRGRYWATVQMAEGEPDPPTVVPVEVSGSRVKFTIREPRVLVHATTSGTTETPAPDFVVNFDGTVTRLGLQLTSGPSKSMMLRRRNSYWQ